MKIMFRLSLVLVFSSGFSQNEIVINEKQNTLYISSGTTYRQFRFLGNWNKASQPIDFSADYGVKKKLTIGVSYSRFYRTFSFFDEKRYTPPREFHYSYHYNVFCARSSLVIFKNDFSQYDNWEINLNVLGGIAFGRLEREWSADTPVDYTNFRNDEDVRYFPGISIGIRFFPIKLLGLYSEFGYSESSYIKYGVVVRLNNNKLP
ncbi:MAG: hypothetical protein ACLGGV_04290 [Bacteroidia bacterium]